MLTQGKARRTKREETHAVTLQPGTRAMIKSAATVAFGFPTSGSLYDDDNGSKTGGEGVSGELKRARWKGEGRRGGRKRGNGPEEELAVEV